MTTGKVTYPPPGFNFEVTNGGVLVGGFSEVTGLKAEVEVHEYREGGRNDYIHRLAGPVRYPDNLVLKHGIAGAELWEWFQQVAKGPAKNGRKQLTIKLLDTEGMPVWTWNVKDAFPVRWVGPDLRASNSEVAVESVELVHRGISKA